MLEQKLGQFASLGAHRDALRQVIAPELLVWAKAALAIRALMRAAARVAKVLVTWVFLWTWGASRGAPG